MRPPAVTRAVLGLGLGLGAAGCTPSPTTPAAIQREIARSPKNTATVVIFTDFQCPYCRRAHAALAPLLAEQAGRVRVVVKHVPLRIHPRATDAARASVCGERLVRDPAALDHALFSADRLEPGDLVDLAAPLGAPREAFEACLSAPETSARIVSDIAEFDALRGEGVPLVFVNEVRFDGAAQAEEYRRAFSR